jgi:hypothetical protein
MSEPGRRSATRRTRLSPTALLGGVLVVATVGALLLVRPTEPEARTQRPAESTLSSASAGCPAALAGAETAYVGTGLDDVTGEVTVGAGDDAQPLPVRPHEVGAVEGAGEPFVVSAKGDLAPGLLAARFGGPRLAALACPAPAPETWFTGVGAGADHTSVIELVNPDEGPAVADITVSGRSGRVNAPDLRGVSVRGHDSVRLDLAEVLPRRNELALHVVVSRGRLATSVLDVVPALGSRPQSEDWLAPQSAPAPRTVLLGLPGGVGEDVLAVANPGEDEARVKVRILTADSAFAPEGFEELRVPPGAVRTVTLTSALRAAVRDGALGIDVTATVPVTATLRSVVGGDVSHAVPVLPSREPMTALVPPGAGAVVVADADGVGAVTVTSWSADGKRLQRERFEVRPETGGRVDLPEGAALVRVSSPRAAVHAAALVTGPRAGAAVVPFREPVTKALIPAVRPGLP